MPLREVNSLGVGCIEERRLAVERADIDVCAVRWRGRTEGDIWGPVPARSRYDKPDAELRRGVVVPTAGVDLPALSGDLSGILDSALVALVALGLGRE